MKTLFWVVALFALAVGLVVAARYNDGYALLVLPPYRLEISLNLLFVVLAGGFVLLYTLVRLALSAVQMPSRVRQYRVERRRERAHSALLTALEAFLAGRYADAEQVAVQSMEQGEHAPLFAALAARAAQEQGAFDRRDRYVGATAGVNASE